MECLSTGLAKLFDWVTQSSLSALAAVIIIPIIQVLGRRLLPPRWSYALWLILLARLALPVAPECGLSVWNLMPQENHWKRFASDAHKMPDSITQDAVGDSFIAINYRRLSPPNRGIIGPHKIMDAFHKNSLELHPMRKESWSIAFGIWLAGAVTLLTSITVGNLRLWNSVRKLRLVTEQPLLELLEDCKQQMQARAVVGLVFTDKVKCPSLFGFVRPRFLLPIGLAADDCREELRYVFLHELAHIKRGDIWIGWIAALLQSLHWFNPLVWLAFHRMRADRELACDALVLAHIANEERNCYGSSLIALLERFNHSPHLPVVAGILESKTQLKKRITMIAKFKHPTRLANLSAAALLAVIAGALLTDAQEHSIPSITGQATRQNIQTAQSGARIQKLPPAAKIDQIRSEDGQIGAAQLAQTVPFPGDRYEPATTVIAVPSTPAERAAVFSLLERALQNGDMHMKGSSPFYIDVSFYAGGNVSYSGSGALTETWKSGQNWRWTAMLGGYSQAQIGARGTIYAEKIASMPLRVHMLRNTIFWPVKLNSASTIRTAAVTLEGKPGTCVLVSGVNLPVDGIQSRLWQETEYCMDNASGRVQIYSIAPGSYAYYRYAKNLQYHGRFIPDQITFYVRGAMVLDAQIRITDPGSSEDSLLVPTQQMLANGPAITVRMPERFRLDVPTLPIDSPIKPVIVLAEVDVNGKVLESELVSASDPALGATAMDLVKGLTFPDQGVQRQTYINFSFVPAPRF